jgi:pimeloyl-ACP methyl ester carboxylesterase
MSAPPPPQALPEPDGLFMGRHLRAWYYPGRTGKLVVTFDFRKTGRTGFLPANYSTSFARMGHAQLSIKTAANDWFINPETQALEDVIRAIAADHASVHLMGYSMGGYGALRFARALNADSAVLVSPQFTIDRALAPFEDRYPQESAVFDPVLGDIRPHAKPDLRGFALIDPFVPRDRAHARLISDLFPAIRIVRLACGGHPASRLLAEVKQGWLIQHAAVSIHPDPARIRAAHRAGRVESAGYWLRLAEAAQNRHPAGADAARAVSALLSRRGDDQGPHERAPDGRPSP